MSRTQKAISEKVKEEMAEELDIYDRLSSHCWGSITTRNTSKIVRKFIDSQQTIFNGK